MAGGVVVGGSLEGSGRGLIKRKRLIRNMAGGSLDGSSI